MTERSEREEMVEQLWHTYLTTGQIENERRQRSLFRLLPGSPRCKNCYAPFKGAGSAVVRLVYRKQPSNLNPQLCNFCEQFAQEYQGGAEVELSLLFADVRGSTQLAESMTPLAFSKLINRFYNAATQVLVRSDALIDKIIGDQVAAMFVPGFVGPAHAARNSPWIPLGAGVHTGVAFVGSVGSENGPSDITVLGDVANTAARLASSAAQGEILLSDAAAVSAGIVQAGLEQRQLELKGKSQPMLVHVVRTVSRVR